jgi:hypothetical protein
VLTKEAGLALFQKALLLDLGESQEHIFRKNANTNLKGSMDDTHKNTHLISHSGVCLFSSRFRFF